MTCKYGISLFINIESQIDLLALPLLNLWPNLRRQGVVILLVLFLENNQCSVSGIGTQVNFMIVTSRKKFF